MLVGVRKSPIGRQNLPRQTVITVIFTVPINFIHIQTDVSLKTHFSIMYAENSTNGIQNTTMLKPIYLPIYRSFNREAPHSRLGIQIVWCSPQASCGLYIFLFFNLPFYEGYFNRIRKTNRQIKKGKREWI